MHTLVMHTLGSITGGSQRPVTVASMQRHPLCPILGRNGRKRSVRLTMTRRTHAKVPAQSTSGPRRNRHGEWTRGRRAEMPASV